MNCGDALHCVKPYPNLDTKNRVVEQTTPALEVFQHFFNGRIYSLPSNALVLVENRSHLRPALTR